LLAHRFDAVLREIILHPSDRCPVPPHVSHRKRKMAPPHHEDRHAHSCGHRRHRRSHSRWLLRNWTGPIRAAWRSRGPGARSWVVRANWAHPIDVTRADRRQGPLLHLSAQLWQPAPQPDAGWAMRRRARPSRWPGRIRVRLRTQSRRGFREQLSLVDHARRMSHVRRRPASSGGTAHVQHHVERHSPGLRVHLDAAERDGDRLNLRPGEPHDPAGRVCRFGTIRGFHPFSGIDLDGVAPCRMATGIGDPVVPSRAAANPWPQNRAFARNRSARGAMRPSRSAREAIASP